MDNNVMMIIGGGAALLVGYFGQSTERQTLSASQQAISANAVAIEIESEAIAASNDLAIARYDSGACIRSTVPLVDGMVVPSEYAGRFICDAYGTTMQIDKKGRLTLPAKTGDAAAITRGLR